MKETVTMQEALDSLSEAVLGLGKRVAALEKDSHPPVALPIDRLERDIHQVMKGQGTIEAKLNEVLARVMPAGAAVRRLAADEDGAQRDQAASLRAAVEESTKKESTKRKFGKNIRTHCQHCGSSACWSLAPGPGDWAPCPQAPKEEPAELTREESTKHLTCPKCTEIMGLMCPGCGHQPEESTKPITTVCPHCGDHYCSSQAPGPFDWAPCPHAPKEEPAE